MTAVLASAVSVAVVVFVATGMAAAGLTLSASELATALRPRRAAAALLANFVFAPAAALALVAISGIARPYGIGLLLLGSAAGAPFLPKLAEAARGNLGYAVGLMLLLMVASAAFLPLALPLLIPGLAAEPWPILKPLLVTMLLPLALGMAAFRSFPEWAGRVRRAILPVSNAAMIAAVLLLVGLNFEELLGTFGTGAVAVGATYVAVATAIGWVLGEPRSDTRSVLGLGTGQRNIAAALLIATDHYSDEPGVVVMLLATTLVGLIPLLLAARRFARAAAAPQERT